MSDGTGDSISISNTFDGAITTTADTTITTTDLTNVPAGHAWVGTGGTYVALPPASSGPDISIDAEVVAQHIKDRLDEILQDPDRYVAVQCNGYSWCQVGLREAAYSFDTLEEAVEHAEKHASPHHAVSFYREGACDGETQIWSEHVTYDWNVNMKLVFGPDPRTRTEREQSALKRPCPRCGNTGALRFRADECYCRLCGKTVCSL